MKAFLKEQEVVQRDGGNRDGEHRDDGNRGGQHSKGGGKGGNSKFVKTGWLNKSVALVAAVLGDDWEMAMVLADEYSRHPSMEPLLTKYRSDQQKLM